MVGNVQTMVKARTVYLILYILAFTPFSLSINVWCSQFMLVWIQQVSSLFFNIYSFNWICCQSKQ